MNGKEFIKIKPDESINFLTDKLKLMIKDISKTITEVQFDEIISFTIKDIDEETLSVEMCLFDWLVTIV